MLTVKTVMGHIGLRQPVFRPISSLPILLAQFISESWRNVLFPRKQKLVIIRFDHMVIVVINSNLINCSFVVTPPLPRDGGTA